jgi:hypothetical protein
MSFVLETILVCASDTPLDARNHWPLHDALHSLSDWLDTEDCDRSLWHTSGLPALQFVKDPDVGWRAQGVTRAIWELVDAGTLLCVETSCGQARFELTDAAMHHIRRELMALSPECATLLQRTGQRFAQNATMAS